MDTRQTIVGTTVALLDYRIGQCSTPTPTNSQNSSRCESQEFKDKLETNGKVYGIFTPLNELKTDCDEYLNNKVFKEDELGIE